MTQAPATGLWGPGDFGPDFVTLEVLQHNPAFFASWDRACRNAVIDCLLDLAHDLDARANGYWEIVEGKEPEWHPPTQRGLALRTSADLERIWSNGFNEGRRFERGEAITVQIPIHTANADLVTGGE